MRTPGSGFAAPISINWQPCGTWAGPQASWVLANNVLSDPASISLLFLRRPDALLPSARAGDRRPGAAAALTGLLAAAPRQRPGPRQRLRTHVRPLSQRGGFADRRRLGLLADLRDTAWVGRQIDVLHRMADYLQRRDVDKDGLIESYGSGNAGTLRDPDRADIWFEMMNFGHKNAWANALEYRAFLCMAEMLDATGHPKGGNYYRGIAAKLREGLRASVPQPQDRLVRQLDQPGRSRCTTTATRSSTESPWPTAWCPRTRASRILSRVVAEVQVDWVHRMASWRARQPHPVPPRGHDSAEHRPRRTARQYPRQRRFLAGRAHRGGSLRPSLPQRHDPPRAGLVLLARPPGGRAERRVRPNSRRDDANRRKRACSKTASSTKASPERNTSTSTAERAATKGYLPESYNFLMGEFTRNPAARAKLLGVFDLPGTQR